MSNRERIDGTNHNKPTPFRIATKFAIQIHVAIDTTIATTVAIVAINSQLQRPLHTMTTQLQRNCICNSSIATMTTPELQHIPIATHQLQHTGHTITTSPHLNCNTQHIPIATHTNCNTRVTQLQHTNCNTHATQLQLHHN